MKTFIYNDELYIQCIPAKSLFRSNLVHEVVNRGDVFAVRVSDQYLTIIPGTAKVEHKTHGLTDNTEQTKTVSGISKEEVAAERKRLKELADEIRSKQRALPGFL